MASNITNKIDIQTQIETNTQFLLAARYGNLERIIEFLDNGKVTEINTYNANGMTALHFAAKEGHIDIVKVLLKRGAAVNNVTKKKNTALHIASLAGKLDVIKVLIENNADINVRSFNGFSPLYMASQENHDNCVQYLLSKGASQSLITDDGFTPLNVATQQGHMKVVALLLKNGTITKIPLPNLHIAAKKDDVESAALLLKKEVNQGNVSKNDLQPLHIAAHYDSVKVADLLLNHGADVNYKAEHNITPLHVACKWGKVNMVELLLAKGSKIDSITDEGLTPLHCAARNGNEEVINILLKNRAPIFVKSKNGLTPLHMAAQGDHDNAARNLLNNMAPVDEVTGEFLTALHVATHCGHAKVAQLLLERNANPNFCALNGFTPLHIACKTNRLKLVELLLKHGANVNATSKSGLTPLHVACFMGYLSIVVYLLQFDAISDVKTIKGETPLHLASRANQIDVVLILLQNGTQVDIKDNDEQTPLHVSSRLGNIDIVKLLLQNGANVESSNKELYTSLHIATKVGEVEIALFLIENGASLDATTKKGFTPLHLAVKYDNLKIVQLLLQKDSLVDAQDKNGVTPLHISAYFGHIDIIKFLLQNDANIEMSTIIGYRPLHLAAQQGNINIVKLLLEYKANPNTKTNNGLTALNIAEKLEFFAVVEILKEISESNRNSIIVDKDVELDVIYETFNLDIEDEDCENPFISYNFNYMMANMKQMSVDDQFQIPDVDNRLDSNLPLQRIHIETYDGNSMERLNPKTGFLVSFLVDAKGRAMRGCQRSGVCIYIPPQSVTQSTRITCRFHQLEPSLLPPLMDGESLVSQILELNPVSTNFQRPVIVEMPHFASLKDKDREISIKRFNNGMWREHIFCHSEEAIQHVFYDCFEKDQISQIEDFRSSKLTRIVTKIFPQYFAIISRVKREVRIIGPEGGNLISSISRKVQVVIPPEAVIKNVRCSLSVQLIGNNNNIVNLIGSGNSVSPIITVEPMRTKFHKPIVINLPAPKTHKGTTSSATLRFLCSMSGSHSPADWKDFTGAIPLSFENGCCSFSTVATGRYWLIDLVNDIDINKFSNDLYKYISHVPFMVKFIIFTKRVDSKELKLSIYCITDDRDENKLEHEENFIQVGKSQTVEIFGGRPIYLQFTDNLNPIPNTTNQLSMEFNAFKDNHLNCTLRVKEHKTVGEIFFMNEPKVPKIEQKPICSLKIPLSDKKIEEIIQRGDIRVSDICNLLDSDWEKLAVELGFGKEDIEMIKTDYPWNKMQQAVNMLRLWVKQGAKQANGNIIEQALHRINRDDIINDKCIINFENVTDEMEKTIAKMQLEHLSHFNDLDETGKSLKFIPRNITNDDDTNNVNVQILHIYRCYNTLSSNRNKTIMQCCCF